MSADTEINPVNPIKETPYVVRRGLEKLRVTPKSFNEYDPRNILGNTGQVLLKNDGVLVQEIVGQFFEINN
jgi:hypothetical protein